MNFTQLTTDFSRPAAGPESWSGQYTVPYPATQDFYYRFNWCDIQLFNGGGSFDWTMFDQKINYAIDNNLKFSFCIMQLCTTCYQGGNVGGAKLNYPLYVHNAMQSESVKDYIVGGNWIPNYNSTSYLNAWKNLNQQVYAHILAGSRNGRAYKDVINCIDVSGFGDYGEWANTHPEYTAQFPTIASMKFIIDATVQSYPIFQCQALIAKFDCQTLTSNVNIPAEVGYYALTTSNQKGKLGIRSDSWGANDWFYDAWTWNNTHTFNGLLFGPEIAARYKIAPVTGEPINDNADHFNDLDRQINKMHVSSIGNGNLVGQSSVDPSFANLTSAFRKIGGKWTLINGDVASNILTLSFKNLGLSPVYEDFIVKYYLKQGGVTKFSKATVNLKLALADFSDVVDFSAASGGTYDLYISIEDPKGFRKPYPLAITGRQTDGSYLIQSSITITNQIPAMPSGVVSIFTTQVPTSVTDNDHTASVGQEVGLKFKSSVSGYVTGLRFYKTTGNAGVHTGELYDLSGNRLAQVVFTNETATGWQTAQFTTPVLIQANTVYVAAYHSSLGNYVEDNDYFTSAGVTNGVLTALKAADAAGNAPFKYSAVPVFPDQYYRDANYFVDVLFSANQGPISKIGSGNTIILQKASYTLDGSQSSDPDGTVVGYLWEKVSGPAGDVISSPNASATQVNGLITGVYVYKLTVTDNNGATNSSQYTITVTW